MGSVNNEPVAWLSQGGDVSRSADYFEEMGFKDLIPLYTHPVKELTDEEIEEVIKTSTIKISGLEAYDYCYPQNYRLDEKLFARAILRKASEK